MSESNAKSLRNKYGRQIDLHVIYGDKIDVDCQDLCVMLDMADDAESLAAELQIVKSQVILYATAAEMLRPGLQKQIDEQISKIAEKKKQ